MKFSIIDYSGNFYGKLTFATEKLANDYIDTIGDVDEYGLSPYPCEYTYDEMCAWCEGVTVEQWLQTLTEEEKRYREEALASEEKRNEEKRDAEKLTKDFIENFGKNIDDDTDKVWF